MKRILIAVAVLISVQGFTQQERKERTNAAHKMQRMANLSPEEIATLKTKRMTLALDLNQAQQDKIYKLNLDNAIALKAKIEELKAKKEQGNIEKPTKEERLKMANERLDKQIAHKAEMKTILNDEQYAKWEASREKMAKRAKHMKKGFKKGKHNKEIKKS